MTSTTERAEPTWPTPDSKACPTIARRSSALRRRRSTGGAGRSEAVGIVVPYRVHPGRGLDQPLTQVVARPPAQPVRGEGRVGRPAVGVPGPRGEGPPAHLRGAARQPLDEFDDAPEGRLDPRAEVEHLAAERGDGFEVEQGVEHVVHINEVA